MFQRGVLSSRQVDYRNSRTVADLSKVTSSALCELYQQCTTSLGAGVLHAVPSVRRRCGPSVAAAAASPTGQTPPLPWPKPNGPRTCPPNPHKRAHGSSIHSQQSGSIGIRSVVVPRLEFAIHLLGDRHCKRPPRHRFHSQRLRKKQSYTFIRLSICSPSLAASVSFGSSALTRVLRARFSSAPSTLGAGRLIAMAGAMKTFWVLLLVVAMAAVAAQAHNGVDHGPAGAPHAEAPDMGSGAELLASWLSPLLLAGAAFAASVLRS